MALDDGQREFRWDSQSESNPFAEAALAADGAAARPIGFGGWNESVSPFTEAGDGFSSESGADQLLAEAFAELRDTAFDESVAFLAEETEQAVWDRFASETPTSAAERERFADAHLSSVRFEATQYLDALETGLEGLDVESLAEDQLDGVLDRFDPQPGELTPAGEEFIGSLVRKAKKAVKFVAKAAKNVGKFVGKAASAIIGPVLKKLRGLIQPLLRRVLSFAIGRLPKPLQAPARALASKLLSEADEASTDEAPMSPASLTDVEALAESFDGALAEAIANPSTETDLEDYAEPESAADLGGRELEVLAEARAELIDRIRSAQDEQDLAPAVEQFIPALLGALRLGISLVGRPKVVGFLGKFLGQLIRRWVGPSLSGPLSNAIVDTGLRLISLEAEGANGSASSETAGPVALASVIEDTVRRLAESEDYVLENEDLTHLAATEAFASAVATHFPTRFVKPALQQAPTLAGTFAARRPRSPRPYHKYTRIPEIEVTAQVADALATFGGATVGAALRAAGATFPMRARVHIYQSAVGTALPRMIRMDRSGGARGFAPASHVHPLTPEAAGLLLREPKLGVTVPASFLQTRNRIAVGQRFYVLEPMGAAGAMAATTPASARLLSAQQTPTRSWITVNARKARITVGFYFSETDAQTLAGAIRQGRGAPALLQALSNAFQALDRSASGANGGVRLVREDSEDFEGFAGGGRIAAELVALLRKRIRGWVLPALAAWARTNAEAVARAANHPDPGITIRVRLTAVPGLEHVGGGIAAMAMKALASFRGTPALAITVSPGRQRP